MNPVAQGVLTVVGRVFIVTIFLLSAVANKIPQFQGVAQVMGEVGIPAPQFMLTGAILFLIAGSLSIALGFRARIGAGLLLVFLILATYFFHNFWAYEGAEAENQTIQFMKNLSMMGTMLFIIANGSGKWSLDDRLSRGGEAT
ncbi:DoxX family protein [Bremerella cremea]|uniref:DoxX family protein n=1 Tax=Bremerella cremea TaxID=1031537 RepID=A0A368KSA6_9BACT|nr:DoxX family protein [Bremerella cremea]RCS47777.1 DoxX family protein [Bremerella cremea]